MCAWRLLTEALACIRSRLAPPLFIRVTLTTVADAHGHEYKECLNLKCDHSQVSLVVFLLGVTHYTGVCVCVCAGGVGV